jgi:hypothetical protein
MNEHQYFPSEQAPEYLHTHGPFQFVNLAGERAHPFVKPTHELPGRSLGHRGDTYPSFRRAHTIPSWLIDPAQITW